MQRMSQVDLAQAAPVRNRQIRGAANNIVVYPAHRAFFA